MSLGIAEHVYIGRRRKKHKRTIGIYVSKHILSYRAYLDDSRMKGCRVLFVSLLVHWNSLQEDTEKNAWKLYKQLAQLQDVHKIKFIQPLVPEPVDVGKDTNGINEMVIEAAVVYERKRK